METILRDIRCKGQNFTLQELFSADKRATTLPLLSFIEGVRTLVVASERIFFLDLVDAHLHERVSILAMK